MLDVFEGINWIEAGWHVTLSSEVVSWLDSGKRAGRAHERVAPAIPGYPAFAAQALVLDEGLVVFVQQFESEFGCDATIMLVESEKADRQHGC